MRGMDSRQGTPIAMPTGNERNGSRMKPKLPTCPTHPQTRLVCPSCLAAKPRKPLTEAERAARRARLAAVRGKRWPAVDPKP